MPLGGPLSAHPTSPSPRDAADLSQELALADEHIREGRFQRSLALLAGLSSIPSGLEVSYEHYRGSYSQRIMYTPIIMSGVLTATGLWGVKSRWAGTVALRWVSYATLVDCFTGFYFHIRGIQRKPGGWRIPIVNIVMGPPIFAPLLFGVSAYLGVIASHLRREEDDDERGGELMPRSAREGSWHTQLTRRSHEPISWEQDLREGRFQKHVAAATAMASFFSAFEAWYSHYKNRFEYKVQWTPLVVGGVLIATAVASIKSRRVAHKLLPAVSAVAVVNGAIGFGYHARGVLRRPAGAKKPLYNIMYGPPIFAPLLFAACGMLGLLASLLRREK